MKHRWLKRLNQHSQKALIEAYQEAFHGETGKKILKDLALYCKFNETSFIPEDPCATAFNEGARDAFLHILEMLHLDPQSLINHDQKDH